MATAPWHMAKALEVLLREVNASAPHRSKVSDGGIGDARHASKTSDHVPCPCCRVVCARDFTHDPRGGLDAHVLADFLRARALQDDRRIKYVIWNRKIMSGPGQRNPVGVWRKYQGTNAHTKHLHLSVTHERVDDVAAWGWLAHAAS